MVDEDELLTDGEIEEDEVYVEYDIAAYPSDLTLEVLHNMRNSEEILIPEYQRNFVWNIKQASLLIESFLMNLPVPQVFFYVNKENKFEVIDGQQRIFSFCYYFEGYFGEESTHGKRKVFRLTGLDEISPYHNKSFIELDEISQRKLKSRVLRAINIRQMSPEGERTSVYHIFERLNTGGTPLKPQEIRNCVFRGDFVKGLRELNEDVNWRKILGKNTIDKYQKDIELILRVFSLYQAWEDYEKPMKEFLNKSMDLNKNGDTKKVKQFASLFPKITDFITNEFGDKPFNIRGPVNSSALDSIICILMENEKKLQKVSRKEYENLINDAAFQELTYVSTSDAVVLKKRFKVVKEIFFGK